MVLCSGVCWRSQRGPKSSRGASASSPSRLEAVYTAAAGDGRRVSIIRAPCEGSERPEGGRPGCGRCSEKEGLRCCTKDEEAIQILSSAVGPGSLAGELVQILEAAVNWY